MHFPDMNVTRTVTLWVAGIPKPQGSKRAFIHPHTKRVVMTESAGAPLKDWRYDMKMSAIAEMSGEPLMVQPFGVRVTVLFIMPRPVSLPKTRATPLAVKKPDLDKLVRAVGDSLTGVVYADDSQVVSMALFKRIAELGESPGAHILVEEVSL